VRLYISQSSGAGRSSISVETPGTVFSAAPSFFCALAATARVARTPISRTVFFMRASETPSAFEIVCRLAFGLTQNETCHFAGGVHNEFDVRTRRLERRLRERNQRKRIQVESVVDERDTLVHAHEAGDNR